MLFGNMFFQTFLHFYSHCAGMCVILRERFYRSLFSVRKWNAGFCGVTGLHRAGRAGRSEAADRAAGEVWKMIEVTKLNGEKILVNPHLFEVVEETPDTVITLTTGKKIIVKESRQEIKNLVKLYRKDIFTD